MTLKNWPRIWMISFKQNITAFPTENRPGFSKAKARSANGVYDLLSPVPESCESKIVLLLLFDRRNAAMSKLWTKGLRESFQKGNVPCAKPQHNSNATALPYFYKARKTLTQNLLSLLKLSQFLLLNQLHLFKTFCVWIFLFLHMD